MAGFHVVLFFPGNPAPHYYWRDSERRMTDGALAPQFSDRVQDARYKVLSAEAAVAERDRFRRYWSNYRIVIRSVTASSGSSDDLFEDRSAEVRRREAPPVRENYQADGILIVAGQSSGYYIRFPGSAFESLRGETPDEVYAKYLEQVALRPILAEYAEKVPDMSDAEFATQIESAKRAIQQARFGPGRRRPGDH